MRPSILRRTAGFQPPTRLVPAPAVCSVHLAPSLHHVQQCRTPTCGLPSRIPTCHRRSSNVSATAAAAGPQGSDSEQPAEEAAAAAAAAAAAPPLPLQPLDPAVAADMEAEELDEAQEQLLKWLLFKDDAEQERDLDEMIDYTEFGDDEYEELFEELDAGYEQFAYDFKVGDKVLGTVTEVDDGGAYIDVGAKGSAFMPTAEASFARLKTALEVVRPGMRREFLVVGDEDEYGQIMLSLGALECSTFWARIRQLQEEDVTVQVVVESANRGGLLVKYGQYEGFMPVSQFGPQISTDTMENMVGTLLPAKFLEVDEELERLVFSNRRAATTQAEAQGFVVGQVVTGVVQSVKPYGAFVDLGSVIGLLHVSQISHERVASVDKILAEGDKLKVMILSMDRDRGRVTLSTKKLEATPGDMLKDPQLVFEKAEEMAETFRRAAVVAGLQPGGGPLDGGRLSDTGGGGAGPPGGDQGGFMY